MPRISAGSNVVAFDSQTDVRFISMRRVDSQGNLATLDRVLNRPVAVVSAQPRPSAPPRSHHDFSVDFAASRSPERALSPHPSRGAHLWSCDMPTQVDDPLDAPPPYSVTPAAHPWGAPPPYSATDGTPHSSPPSAPAPDAAPAYRPPGFEWTSRHGYPGTTV